jgi:hypothetical protein
MTIDPRRWRTVLLAAPVIGALAFGGTQALASPAAAALEGGRCAPDPRCDSVCPVMGGFPVSSTSVCRCCQTSPIGPRS